MTAPKQNPNHRIGQENRRRKEADARLEADAAERDERVYNLAKAYTDEQVGQVQRDLKVTNARLNAVEARQHYQQRHG